MKNIFRILSAAAIALVCNACLGDLDTLPLNETDNTSETAYENEDSYLMGLAYVNAYWSFVSQTEQRRYRCSRCRSE